MSNSGTFTGGPPSDVDAIGCAIIGTGGYARVLAAKLVRSGRFAIRWCVHYDESKARRFAADFDAAGTASIDKALAEHEVEAVFIVTPNDLHASQGEAALAVGKHVFIEKPLAQDANEAERLCNQAVQAKRILMVGHNYRRKPAFRAMKRMLDEGQIGAPVHFDITVSHGGAFNFPPDSWRNDPERCKGGPLSMLSSHGFDVATQLLGRPAWISASVTNMAGQAAADDSAVCLIGFESGATAVTANHYVVPSLEYARLQGTDGTVTYEFGPNRLLYRTGRDIESRPAETREIDLPDTDDRMEQIVEFAEAIRNGGGVETDGQMGLGIVRMLDAALDGAQTNAVIPLISDREPA